MKLYEVIRAGQHGGHTIRGWHSAKSAAVLEAAIFDAAVGVWAVRDAERRELRGTVFPDGRWAWERPLHRLPKGL